MSKVKQSSQIHLTHCLRCHKNYNINDNENSSCIIRPGRDTTIAYVAGKGSVEICHQHRKPHTNDVNCYTGLHTSDKSNITSTGLLCEEDEDEPEICKKCNQIIWE